MFDYSGFTKAQLIEQVQRLHQIANQKSSLANEDLIQELRVHQIELEMQNTRLRETQKKLELARDRYADLYDSAPIGYTTLNGDGLILDINLAGAHILGKQKEELKGLPFGLFIDPDNRSHFYRYLKQVFAAKNKVVTEFSIKSSAGISRHAFLESIAVLDGKNKVNHCHTAIIDITERKQAEEMLYLAHNELERKVEQRTTELTEINKALEEEIAERKRVETELSESEKRYRTVVDTQNELICRWNADATLTFVNNAYCRYFGKQRDELVGHKFMPLILEEDREKVKQHFISLTQRNPVGMIEHRVVASNGEIRWQQWTNFANFDEQGRITDYQSVGHDVTDQKHADQQLRQAATVFESTNEAIIIADADNNIILVNQAFCKITGFQTEEVIGKKSQFLSFAHHNDAFFQEMSEILERHQQWQGEILSGRKSGESFTAWENISVVKDDRGQVTNYVIIFSDISCIKKTEERLNHLAHHDALTNVPNRLLFEARLQSSLQRAQRHGNHVALLFMDLDRFKIINDTLGHNAGDQLLKTVASRLQDSIRDEDTVARFGGDEFALILEDVKHPDDTAYLAEKVLEIITEPMQIADQEITTSCSIGVAVYPIDANDGDNLKRAADSALYQAKRSGRANYQFYATELSERALNLLNVEHGLRQALRSDQFELYYQPQIDLETEQVVAIEALLRWQHPELGILDPGKFINVAEDTGLIHSIGRWVLNTACAQVLSWQKAGLPRLRISVNLSGHTLLHDPKLVQHVEHALKVSGLEPQLLELEITESAIQTAEHGIAVLFELKTLGVGLAIDDFGTGYSCLSSLKRLPINTLKIDRSFIQDIPFDENDKAIASTIIAMARTLNLKVVAEGVQDNEQLSFLRSQRCDMVQGNIFIQAVAAREMEKYLKCNIAESIEDVT